MIGAGPAMLVDAVHSALLGKVLSAGQHLPMLRAMVCIKSATTSKLSALTPAREKPRNLQA
jgi:hypothetical protein